MKKPVLEDVETITRRIIEESFAEGDYAFWFSHLSRNTVFICGGEPRLIGDTAIRSHFKKKTKIRSKIVKIELQTIPFGEIGAQVFGQFVLTTEGSHVYATVYFTVAYKLIGSKTKLVLQHMFYGYNAAEKQNTDSLNVSLDNFEYINNLLIDFGGERISLKSGNQTVYVDPSAVLYVDSRGRNTEIVCLDRKISSNLSITEMQKILPDYFYPLRRGNLTNLHYLTQLRCYEAELLSHIIIPVPELTYTKVKQDVNAFFARK